MSRTYYSSLSGMLAASYGLQNSSNNIANMQSPGFKRTDLFYSSLGRENGQASYGSGVYVSGQACNFSPGNYLETNKATDLSIVGNGFFILKLKNGELLYTRDGEFSFNKDGLLADKHSQGLVQGYSTEGALVNIHQFGPSISAGLPSQSIDLKGELVSIKLDNESDPNPESKYEAIQFKVTVFDYQGKSHTVTALLKSIHSPADFEEQRHWELTDLSCPDANISFDPLQVIEFEYEDGGAAKQGSNRLSFNFSSNDTSQLIKVNFGDFREDPESSVRLFEKDKTSHSSTNIEEKKQDGYGFGKQIGFSFDDNGLITYAYDNGQFEIGAQLALSVFEDMEHALIPTHDNLFRAKENIKPRIGRPNEQHLGNIQVKSLESANVDSTTEFAHIVVLQRMFQACSQIMDIDKQLLEDLNRK